MAKSDVLILLDCCASGVGNASEGNGVTELICACPYNSRANGVGPYSFSHALTTELRLLSKKPCFSVGELYSCVYTRLQSYLSQGLENEGYPAPIHLPLTQDSPYVRGIQLSVQEKKQTERDRQEIQLKKRVRFEGDHSINPSASEGLPGSSNKRLRLSKNPVPSIDSRLEEIVLPWIDASEPQDGVDTSTKLSMDSSDLECSQPHEAVDRLKEQKACFRDYSPRDSLYPLPAPRALSWFVSERMFEPKIYLSSFLEWLRSVPAIAEEVVIEGAFESFSTIVLISVPLSTASYLPQDLAITFLGAIKAPIMIPRNERSACRLRKRTSDGDFPSLKRPKEGGKERANTPSFESGMEAHPSIVRFNNEALPRTSENTGYLDTVMNEPANLIETQESGILLEPKKPLYNHGGPDEKMSEFRVSEPAAIYVRNILDKFPSADIHFAQRLGEANWQRHINIRNRNTMSESVLEEAARSFFQPASVFHDSGFVSSVYATSNYAASLSSFMTKAGDADTKFFRVPPTPRKVAKGIPFECPVCGHIIPAHFLKSRVDWK